MAKYPKISDYWSRYFVYRNIFVPADKSQNRFQETLQFFHFANNALAGDDRLAKV
jgi:hypothetical protein